MCKLLHTDNLRQKVSSVQCDESNSQNLILFSQCHVPLSVSFASLPVLLRAACSTALLDVGVLFVGSACRLDVKLNLVVVLIVVVLTCGFSCSARS